MAGKKWLPEMEMWLTGFGKPGVSPAPQSFLDKIKAAALSETFFKWDNTVLNHTSYWVCTHWVCEPWTTSQHFHSLNSLQISLSCMVWLQIETLLYLSGTSVWSTYMCFLFHSKHYARSPHTHWDQNVISAWKSYLFCYQSKRTTCVSTC